MRPSARAIGAGLTCALAATGIRAQQPPPARVARDSTADTASAWTYESEGGTRFRVEVVARGVRVPFGLAFLPDGRALVTDRPTGRLSLLDCRSGTLTPVEGVPPVATQDDAGLLDVAVHPDFARNRWIYLSYATHADSGNATAVDRARLDGARLVQRERLFVARPSVANGEHFGGRLVLHGGYLFVTVGDRQMRNLAQDVGGDVGKVIRLREDGTVPRDNPFVGRAGSRPEVWSYGHRNPQGLAVNPATGELWEHEHGPKGGDEVNVIRPGRNYGWPAVSYGREYTGEPVGAGVTHGEGTEQPLLYYLPSIAPSGMEFYTGDAFPRWRGSVFVGAMALKHLNRLVVEQGRVIHEERLLGDRGWRVRVVRQGPDGFLYVGVDGGIILRIRPA